MINVQNPKACLVIGATSAIAQALITNKQKNTGQVIYAISQKPCPETLLPHDGIHWFTLDYSPTAIEQVINNIAQRLKNSASVLSQVFIFNGILHQEQFMPEKSIQAFNDDVFTQVITANTLVPMLFLQQITPLLPKKQPSSITILSARIGSIGDNQLGGWYSYRASKAALNMLVKTVAIELSRQFKQLQFLLYHPGTTQSPLSAPFWHHVEPSKQFSPEFSVQCLLNVLANLPEQPKVHYRDWQNKTIEW